MRSLARRVLRRRRSPLEQLVDLAAVVRALPKDLDGSREAEIVERLPGLLAATDADERLRGVPAFAKVAFWHVAHDDLDRLHEAINAGLLDPTKHDGSVHDGEPVLHLPGWDDPDLPRDLFVLADRETTLVAEVVRLRPVGDRLEGVVRVGLKHVDSTDDPVLTVHTPGVTATYSGETSGHRDPSSAAHHRETLDRSTFTIDAAPGTLDVEVSIAGRSARGTLDLVAPTAPTGPVVDSVALTDGQVVVTGRGLDGARLVSDRLDLAPIESTDDRAVWPAVAERWGRGELPLPLGDFVVATGDAPVPLAAGLVSWPTDLTDGPLRAHTTSTGLRVIKPRTDRENTGWGQRRLRADYRAVEAPVDHDLALLQCYWAEVATDSQAAINAELHRRRPGMRLCWGVVDHSVPVPDGAERVVAGTREWYDVLATAGLIVKNTEVGDYTRLRPEQTYLQTFHGQPFKAMGRADFARRMAPWRAEFEATTRRSAFWDAICLPYPEAAAFYDDAYGYGGPAFDQGLPRTDPLLAADTAEVRARARRLLGIRDDQVAVLHATTWRDDLSRGDNTSTDPRLLDVHELAAALGDGFVVLQRSHHSVARGLERVASTGGVVDVTDHPEINDLVLASDVAVLDYSSLRFDYAVTRKPMLFFVPDQEQYVERRGFLFDFADSAPGPLVDDARELPGLIADRSWVADHAGAYAAFNERFNRFHDGRAAERVVDGLLG